MKVFGQKFEFLKDRVLCRAWIRLTGAKMSCQSEHINKRNPMGVKGILLTNLRLGNSVVKVKDSRHQ